MEAVRIAASIILLVCCVPSAFTDDDLATTCENEMESCLKKLEQKHNFMVDLTNPNSPNLMFMLERCDDLKSMATCLKAANPDCPKKVTLAFKTYVDFIEYFCGSGLDLSLKYSECLSNNSSVSGMKECAMTYASEFQSASEDAQKTCGFLADYGDCMQGAARVACGQDAAAYIQKILGKLINPNKEVIGCTASRFFVSVLLFITACLTCIAV